MRFDTFNQVVAWYEQTKPIVSKHHTAADNIRPIGQRNRKWERIKKVDAETYLLLDGCYGNTLYASRNQGDEQYEQDMAPIMWKREADGDYIYIRNGVVGSAHQSRYQFLQWYMPNNARFKYNQSGKHWVHAMTPTGHEEFPLPKTLYTWDYQRKQPDGVDDGKRLKFRVNEGGTFTRVGEAFKMEGTAIDKDLKRQWKPKIDAFYMQAAAFAPMLDTTWSGRNVYGNTIRDWCKEHKIAAAYYISVGSMPTELVRQIVEQEDHELRIPTMAFAIHQIGGKRTILTKEDLSRIKSAYNRLMNKALGLYTTKEI